MPYSSRCPTTSKETCVEALTRGRGIAPTQNPPGLKWSRTMEWLNDSQRAEEEKKTRGLATGAGGAGKTFTIVQSIISILLNNEKAVVLVMCTTNHAVEAVMEEVHLGKSWRGSSFLMFPHRTRLNLSRSPPDTFHPPKP